MTRKRAFNPFYGLVVLTGIVFVITTLGYVAALVRQQQAADTGQKLVELGPVLRLLEDRGGSILLWEAGILTVLSVLAMTLDRWQAAQCPTQKHDESSNSDD